MIKKSVLALVVCLLINSIVDLFVYTFLTAHMLSISGNDIAFISRFYVIVFMFIGLGFILLLPIVKKMNKAVVLRVGAVLKALFLLLVVLLGETIINHYIWLGVLYGLFEAVFWSGANTLKNILVESNKIKTLSSVVNVNTKIVGIVCPVLFGLSIDAWSFTKIAIFVLCLMVAEIIFSIFIKDTYFKKGEKSSLKKFLLAVKNNEQRKFVNRTFWALFMRGIVFFFPTFLTYLIILVYKTNTSLGILTTVASVLSIILLVVVNSINRADSKVWLYVCFAFLESLSLILAVVFMNQLVIIIFQIVSVCVRIVIESVLEGLRGSSIRDAKLELFMPEAMTVGEIYLNSGRVIGFLALMLIGVLNSFAFTIVLSCLFVVATFVYYILVGCLKKDINSKKNEETILSQNKF